MATAKKSTAKKAGVRKPAAAAAKVKVVDDDHAAAPVEQTAEEANYVAPEAAPVEELDRMQI